jgi:ABC-type multidrug transport system ATPase subunit
LTLALRAASVALTFIENRFICSMSTTDVERLLADTQASMDSKQKSAYEALAGSISQSIQQWQIAGEPADQSAEYLKRILGEVTAVESTRDGIVEPIRKLNSEINQYFPGREIKVDKLSLGEGSNSIDANALSAGEKQLLSFLCYAAVYNEHVFMVDEPELSLHLDWQRKLITSLRSLGPKHQYFFVTHSPSIYTKFSDYEISFDQYTAQSPVKL